jgi:molybdenum cofactor cytidylyltransferase
MPPTISALLLAAGSSTRMGQPKALLPLQNKPAILHCLATLLNIRPWEIIVILGTESEEAVSLIEKMPVKLMFNTLPQSDMAKSVRLGFQAMKQQATGALICLVDHPLVQAGTLKQMVVKAMAAPDQIIIPTFQGRRGHPTLFPRTLLSEIYQGFNLREIIGRHPDKVTLLPVDDEGIVLEMDTPEDYRKICRRLEETTHGE